MSPHAPGTGLRTRSRTHGPSRSIMTFPAFASGTGRASARDIPQANNTRTSESADRKRVLFRFMRFPSICARRIDELSVRRIEYIKAYHTRVRCSGIQYKAGAAPPLYPGRIRITPPIQSREGAEEAERKPGDRPDMLTCMKREGATQRGNPVCVGDIHTARGSLLSTGSPSFFSREGVAL